ncbi:MAG TPA: hypothetical protein VFE96_04385, partial [Candidatus Bathyarchaeia archaeon]|nr:hypothetical protein [Candidatus Bathyarchaeia archaeon]
NFTWEEFERKINTELNDVLGNYVHRTISFVQTHYKGKVPKYNPAKKQHEKIVESYTKALPKVEERLSHFRLKDALEQIVELAREGNRYLNEHEPWRVYKTDPEAAGETFAASIQVVLVLAILLQPFLPSASKKISMSLTGKPSIPWKTAGQTLLRPGARIRPLQPLFQKVNAKKLRARLDQVRGVAPVEAKA